MSCPPVYDRCVYEGAAMTMQLKLHNPQGLSYDIAGLFPVMHIKQYKADTQYLFSVTGEVVDPTTGMIWFYLGASQTAQMTGPTYKYDVELSPAPTLPPSDVNFVVAGTFRMEQRV